MQPPRRLGENYPICKSQRWPRRSAAENPDSAATRLLNRSVRIKTTTLLQGSTPRSRSTHDAPNSPSFYQQVVRLLATAACSRPSSKFLLRRASDPTRHTVHPAVSVAPFRKSARLVLSLVAAEKMGLLHTGALPHDNDLNTDLYHHLCSPPLIEWISDVFVASLISF